MPSHKHLSVIIDIDSDTVGLALVAPRQATLPEILYTLREKHDKKQVKFILRDILARMQKEAAPLVGRVWSDGISRHVDHTLITLSAPHSHSMVVSSKDVGKKAEDVFEEALVTLFVNGYEVDPGQMKRGQSSWDGDYIVSSAPKALLENISDVVTASLGSRRGVAFRSFLSVLASVVPKGFRQIGTAGAMHISGSQTEVALYEHGRLKKIVVLNVDKEMFTSPLMNSLVSMYLDDALLPENTQDANKLLQEYGGKWLDAWRSASGDVSLDSLVVTGGKVEKKVLESVLKNAFPKAKFYSPTEDALSTLALYSNTL